MHCYTLQDLITVRGGTGQGTINQDESGWVDLADYHDLVVWCQLTSSTNLTSILFQTSPTKDSFYWETMATLSSPSVGTSVAQVLLWNATVPLARWVRWQLNGTPTFDATFRVVLAASAEGMGA